MELDETLFKIGHTKLFLRIGVVANLEEQRDLKLTEIITQLQSLCRGFLDRK